MIQWLVRGILALAIISPALSDSARAADPLPAETRLAASANAPAATVKEFDIAAAQDLTVTLTDFQIPAALTSAGVVITQGDAIVKSANFASPATSATVDVLAAVGHYTVRVIAAPDAAFSVGTFSVCVAPKSDPAACIQTASLAGNVSAQASVADPTISTANVDFNVTVSGTYTVTFADQQFPAALSLAPNLALFQGSTPISLGIASGTVLNLNPGKYTLLAIAQADQTIKVGLYGVTIAGPSGAVFDDSIAVGALRPFAAPNNSSAQTLTLKITDYAFPTALTSASAIVTFGGAQIGSASGAGGPISFTAPASTAATALKVWTYASPGSGAGTYELSLVAGSSSLLLSAFGVDSGAEQAFAFTTPALTAGAYQAVIKDSEFPAILQSLKYAVAQNGVILQQSLTAAPLDFTAAAGPVVVLAAAQPPASGNGLFDVTVNTTATPAQIVFDKTQGVSPAGLFDSQEINLGASGGFDVTLTDLNFPAQFQDLALVVSRGGAILGKIFGGGTFSIAATPGIYQLTFIATPAVQQHYGLYGIKVVASAPTLTLAATPATLVAGESTTLNWTTTDADACTASGGNWTGSKSVNSGSEVVKVDATTTFTLTCTGSGGSSTKTVNVTATPKPASSGGGGGSMDQNLLILLAAVLMLRLLARRSTARPRREG